MQLTLERQLALKIHRMIDSGRSGRKKNEEIQKSLVPGLEKNKKMG